MNREQIHAAISGNLKRLGIEPSDVRVQPDPYAGWHVVVVADDFQGMSFEERKTKTLVGLEPEDFEWLDLMTSEEKKWAGTLPVDSDLEQLPLWPESLARGARTPSRDEEISPVFPSDLDEDLKPPIVATFYSLRGGVGRSTALSYTARRLAAQGHKVVCLDMDLEAPGLAALFGRENDVEKHRGVVELLVQLDQGEEPDFADHLLRLDEAVDLYLIPAGRPDADYARRLQLIDPNAWYREERNPMRLLLDGMREKLPFRPDVVLFDSRTGITPLSAPLLFDLADVAIVVFFPHPQARVGTAALVKGLLAAHTVRSKNGRSYIPEPRFLVSPIPASKAREVVERYEHRALEWIAEWLGAVQESNSTGGSLIESDITHFIRYREDLATSDQILPDGEILNLFQPIADWIERFLPTREERNASTTLAEAKSEILDELRFATGTAEDQADFLQTFVETNDVKTALDSQVPLVLGRKGTGKTAIFRRLSEEGSTSTPFIAQAPAQLQKGRPWILSAQGFGSLAQEEFFAREEVNWRQFWAFYSGLAVWLGSDRDPRFAPPEALQNSLQLEKVSELEVVDAFEKVVGVKRYGLHLNEWIRQIDEALESTGLLLFDGLDTGFGSTQEERRRRTNALEGLLTLWTDLGVGLNNLRFKIVLREDIWRSLRFENKSHLFGRSVVLKWSEPASYYKVVLKQALRSTKFTRFLKELPGGFREPPVDRWTESDVFRIWNLLIGERMQGGKTAFTRNWVWNRLADGNEDHSPRYLLQLFHQILKWERNEMSRSTYERSIIRPRALIRSLPEVSGQALEALKEEFSELEPLLGRLRTLGYTPVQARDLTEAETTTGGRLNEAIALAREVGLLAVYEGTEEDVQRYKVPEIYRWALGMKRRGQK